jgi:NADH-quinone oxidoreductase subunit H
MAMAMTMAMTATETLLIATLAKVVVFAGALMSAVPFLVWVERRGSAFIQDRIGPNRAEVFGFRFAGLLHLVADAIKFLTKESFIPAQANPLFFVLAPAIVVIQSVMAFAVIPIADDVVVGGVTIPMSIARIPGGVVYVFAVASLGVLGIILGGWASGSKYPLLGAVRAASQMLSYEVSLALSVMGALLIYGTLDPNDIVRYQGHLYAGIVPMWGIVLQFPAFLLFLVTIFAECNRTPFDLPEGESELVAGYHAEYSGMKFSMFYMGEYISMITMSSLLVTLFLGGWQVPWAPTATLVAALGMWGAMAVQVASFVVKVAFFLWLFVWVRWTVPRFRYDQLMNLGWKVILPLSLANLTITAVWLCWKG